MKKLLIHFILVATSISPCFASTLGDIWNDIGDNTHVTIAQSAVPSYIYNVAKGRSEIGVTTPVLEYRFLSGDVGYSTAYEDKARGTVLLGGSLHFDKLAAQLFPKTAALTNASINILAPEGIANLWEKLYVGVFVGRDTTESNLNYGLQTGFQFRWK